MGQGSVLCQKWCWLDGSQTNQETKKDHFFDTDVLSRYVFEFFRQQVSCISTVGNMLCVKPSDIMMMANYPAPTAVLKSGRFWIRRFIWCVAVDQYPEPGEHTFLVHGSAIPGMFGHI